MATENGKSEINGILRLAALVGALSGIAGSLGAYAILPYRVSKVEETDFRNEARINANSIAISEALGSLRVDIAVMKSDIIVIKEQVSDHVRGGS